MKQTDIRGQGSGKILLSFKVLGWENWGLVIIYSQDSSRYPPNGMGWDSDTFEVMFILIDCCHGYWFSNMFEQDKTMEAHCSQGFVATQI